MTSILEPIRTAREYLFGTESLRDYWDQADIGIITKRRYRERKWDVIAVKAVSNAFTLMGLLTLPASYILDAHNPNPGHEWAAVCGSSAIAYGEMMRYVFGRQMRKEDEQLRNKGILARAETV